MFKLLFRKNNSNIEEFEIANKYFNVATIRTELSNCTVIPRYSALPFYNELYGDLYNLNSNLLNCIDNFNYIANFEYYNDIKKYTFKTWFDPIDIPDIPMIIKGATNSKKFQWNTHMYCTNKIDAIKKSSLLLQDSMISDQKIIFRKFEKLRTFEIGINGLPFTNEWRFFYYKNKLIDYGYYWIIADKPELATISNSAIKLVQTIANIISNKNNFFSIDIAELETGKWKIVEINSGEQSGLQSIDTNNFYKNLRQLCYSNY